MPPSRSSDLAGDRCLVCGEHQEVVTVHWATEDWPTFLWFVGGFLPGAGLFWMKFGTVLFSGIVGSFSGFLVYVLIHLSSVGTEYLEVSICRSCRRAGRVLYVLNMAVIVGGLLAVPVVLFAYIPVLGSYHVNHLSVLKPVAIGGLVWVVLAYALHLFYRPYCLWITKRFDGSWHVQVPSPDVTYEILTHPDGLDTRK